MKNLRIKTPLLFQLNSYKKVFLFLYGILIAIFVLTEVNVFFLSNQISVTFSNLEMVSVITIFITALFSFKESFRFMMANGISRKSHFAAASLALAILSAVFSLADTLMSTVYSVFTYYRPLFIEIFAVRYGLPGRTASPVPSFFPTLQMQAENFLWSVFFHFVFAMAGFFITVLFYRMNKWLKIIVAVGVPTVLTNGISALDYYVCNGKISAFFQWAGAIIFGSSVYNNPYLSMLNMLLLAVLIALLTWLLARRTVLRRN